MTNVRLIFDDDFYRLAAVLLTNKFLKLETKLRNRYLEVGLPIPDGGFGDTKKYRQWLNKATKLRNTNDLPGTMVEDILHQFNLDTRKESYRNILVSKLFFCKQPWEQPEYSQDNIKLIPKRRGDGKELWVKIEPWTKKADYVNLWETIKNIQRTLTGYRAKEKLQKTFKRDCEVYQLFIETKQSIKSGDTSFNSVMKKMLDNPKYFTLGEQFKDGNIDEQVRLINSRFNKLLDGIDIL